MRMSTPTSSSMDYSNIIQDDIGPIENNRRSRNIPLPLSHMQRTQSEAQLCEDMETAEQRDLNMFYRLVNGIRERQMNLVRENESSTAAAAFYDPAHALTEAEQSLAHIIHTRNAAAAAPTSTTTSFRINTGRRNFNNNFLNNWHTDHNSGVPILEDQCDSIQHQQERSDHQNGWAVGGFDNSSNNMSDACYLQQQQQQHQRQRQLQQQQQPYINHGVAVASNVGIVGTSSTYALPTFHKSHSSHEMTDEGMFDFEL